MTRRAPLVLLPLAAACALSACASAPPPIEPLAHPYKVVLLPVEGAETALAARPGDAADPEEGEVPFALTPEQLRDTIRDGVVDAHVFSDIVVAAPSELRTDEFTDVVAAATTVARRERADLIMRVRVNSARLQDLGPNGSKLWSSFLWFMVPAPVWFADDRSYATSLVVQAELFDPADPVKPTASIVASSGEQELDLFDRGVSPLVIVVPPAWLAGNLETVSKELTSRSVRQLMEKLVEELRTREIPSRFALDASREGAAVAVRVATRRRLRSLEVYSGERLLRGWAEREMQTLVDAAASRPDETVYAARVDVPPDARDAIRVVAEDEAGGREVRTLPSTGAGGGR